MSNKKKRVVINKGEPLTIKLDIGHWVEQEFTHEQIEGLFYSVNNWAYPEEMENAEQK